MLSLLALTFDMERLTQIALPLLLANGCIGGPDAREIARGEAQEIVSHINEECGIGLKTTLNDSSLTTDSTLVDATAQYTLDAHTEDQWTCVGNAVTSYQGPTARRSGCDVGYSYPRGWTEIEANGGMKMSVVAYCLPYLSGENE